MRPLILLAILYTGTATADAELIADESSLSFVSIKNVDVAEAHRFGMLSGRLADDGSFQVQVHLDSVDTRVPIRDDRMRSELFDTARFPLATASGTVDPAAIAGLEEGQSMTAELAFDLALHGTRTVQAANVRITRAGQSLEVATLAPVLLQSAAVGLDGGIEKLREIAGLQSIGKAVPVYFVLRFSTGERIP